MQRYRVFADSPMGQQQAPVELPTPSGMHVQSCVLDAKRLASDHTARTGRTSYVLMSPHISAPFANVARFEARDSGVYRQGAAHWTDAKFDFVEIAENAHG